MIAAHSRMLVSGTGPSRSLLSATDDVEQPHPADQCQHDSREKPNGKIESRVQICRDKSYPETVAQ